MLSSHNFQSVFEYGATSPMLLICSGVIIISLIERFFPRYLKKHGYVFSSFSFDVDENLPNFYQALKMKDKEWFLSENKRMKNQYAYMVANTMTIRTLER